MWNLNTPDHVLHAVLVVLGLTLVLMLYSTWFERSDTDTDGAEASLGARSSRDTAPERG
jgi:hypothetical protein